MSNPVQSKAPEPQSQHKTADRSSEATSQPGLASPYAAILGLQRAAGNQAVSRLLQPERVRAGVHRPRLQRQCAACAASGSRCDECEGEEQRLQRSNGSGGGPLPTNDAPPVVHSVLGNGSGQPLESTTRAVMEAHFGADFGHVRVHTGPQAAESAQAISARAYTVGRDVVFGSGQYAPGTVEGKQLLAHELTHVLQQEASASGPQRSLVIGPADDEYEREADQIARQVAEGEGQRAGVVRHHTLSALAQPRIQRVGAGEWLARFFGGGTFSQEELLAYLGGLDARGTIEDDFDSDNKARAIVEAWKAGGSPYVLTARRVILLIKEMQSGFTGDDDERAILELLERSSNADLAVIFGSGGVSAKKLNGDFHTAEWGQLQDFYARRFEGGMRAVLAGQIRPVGEPVPLGVPLSRRGAAAAEEEQRRQPPRCTVAQPENCPTYEQWLGAFAALPTFVARSGHRVLGPAPAPRATATDPTALSGERRPVPIGGRFRETDRFIDGPTDEWVRNNLPPNLVETAYQLPSDCADIAVILRHVWLAAHHRTEVYRGWVCGSRAGEARSRDIGEIIGQVYTGNVARILNPYTDENGNPIVSFERLQRLLHPGDILVWEHRGRRGERTGGHTQTIVSISPPDRTRDVTAITALQGNQPISRAQAEAIRREDPTAPSVAALRAAPGRRIEVSTLEGDELRDVDGVWTWPDGTVLVAAGPSAAAPRPEPERGRPAVRRLTDWIPALRAASLEDLQGTFEAALLEARAIIEGGRAVADDDARALGEAAGARLWQAAQEAGDLAHESHFRNLEQMRAALRALREASHAEGTRRTFNLIDEAFHLAARGISGIDFRRGGMRTGTRVIKVLLTGFDPFNVESPGQPPRRGEWNPSGAAVLALDGETINVEAGVVAAVESVVLPVSFAEFRAGLVESIVRPIARDVDAVITVSMAPSIAPDEPVRIERYAVGVHQLYSGRLEAVPAGPGGGTGPAIIESRGPLAEIAAETARPAERGGAEIREPTIGTDVEFEFASATEADRALEALGLRQRGRSVVTISDPRALRQILNTMERGVSPQSPGITFRAGGRTFQALIREGPGGNYLSNEVSFRVLRLLIERRGQGAPVSFHVHTQRGTAEARGVIPEDTSSPEGRAALELAQRVRATLIQTLRRMVQAVARRAGATER